MNATLTALNKALAAASASASSATVSIGRDGRGSGIVVADGIVLTNAHALRARTTQVRFADGRTVQAEVRGTDTDGDLITLAVDTAGIAPLPWADADSAPAAGHFVVAAHGNGSVAVASIAATGRTFPGPRGRSITNAIEHTASLARGASGGPLVDLDGKLVGINTNRTDAGYQAIALTNSVRARIEALVGGKSFHRKQLGVALANAATTAAVRKAAGLPEVVGLLIRGVSADSPAARAGLSEGDVIVSGGGLPTPTLDALAHALDVPNDTISFVVVRGTEERTVVVSFAQPDSPAASATPPSEAPSA